MKIAVLLFDGITALDAVGPYEVLSRLPNTTVEFVAKEPGLKTTDNGMLALLARVSIKEFQKSDLMLIPGGRGTEALMKDQVVLEWIRAAHQTSQWTVSVCTGSLVLGAAGLLSGLRATTHWMVHQRLTEWGATSVNERIVKEGRIVTSAGVSAGIDMALALAGWIAGDEVGQMIQLSLEYDPHPPFDSGTPAKAPSKLVEIVRNWNRG